jgi:hypothetical protein
MKQETGDEGRKRCQIIRRPAGGVDTKTSLCFQLAITDSTDSHVKNLFQDCSNFIPCGSGIGQALLIFIVEYYNLAASS